MPESMRAEELRQEAAATVRAGRLEDALNTYDAALAATDDEELRELITVNKADALIALERGGPEVQALASIVMRRRSTRNVYLAAYALVFKYRLENELKRATFYAELALKCAEEADEALWKIGALNELGSIYEIDSAFPQAIECFGRAITLIEQLGDPSQHRLTYGIALENLGCSKILNDEYRDGIAIVERSIAEMESPTHVAEAYIDLCYGYLGLEELEQARHYGEAGLELATESRQIRNAHYLLGEVHYKLDDLDRAEFHFDELARFYPEFRNLKSLLFAIDLRSMVNLKL